MIVSQRERSDGNDDEKATNPIINCFRAIEVIVVRMSVLALKYYAKWLKGFHTWDFNAAPLSKMKLLRVIELYI